MNISEIKSENPPKLPSDILTPDTPAAWFNNKFPGLAEKYGNAVCEEANKNAKPVAVDICEDFCAAILGFEGMPETPTVYIPSENRFYTYFPKEGIYIEQREEDLTGIISKLFLECARACQSGADTKRLEFGFRDTASLSGIIKRAKSVLAKPSEFFSGNSLEYIVCKNGVLRVSDKTLMPFNPDFHCRNKLNVDFNPTAICPNFPKILMRPALGEADLALLQKICGLFLAGKNYSQKLIVLSGTAGGGKGTFIRVLRGIIGGNNIGSLRTQLLGERFEIGRFLGKTILYGPDVQENFLNCKGASHLKALTGGDPMAVELKGSNERPEIVAEFNIIVTCNSRLTVHLEGDTDAWRRRLIIIPYRNEASETKIANLSEQILENEASGVFNWMLEGLDLLRAENWQLKLDVDQQKTVDDLLLESDSHSVFAQECLERDGLETLTTADCYEAYLAFSFERNWAALPKDRFGKLITDIISRKFALPQRHDIYVPDAKPVRGWKGIKLKKPELNN